MSTRINRCIFSLIFAVSLCPLSPTVAREAEDPRPVEKDAAPSTGSQKEDARPVEQAPIQLAPSNANPKLPTLFIVGDSTVHNGTRGQRGWGDELAPFFNTNKMNIVNRAMGGRSSRTFQTEGRWDLVLAEMKPGDYVLVQFGHNDSGELFKGDRPRGSIRGGGEETQSGVVEMTGKTETVHTYGWYMRKYASDARAKGVTPILCSPIPHKIWTNGAVAREAETHGKWTREAAKASGALFIDLNEAIARRYEAMGREKSAVFFADLRTHTTPDGAQLNAECAVSCIKGLHQSWVGRIFGGKKSRLVKSLSDKGKEVKSFAASR